MSSQSALTCLSCLGLLSLAAWPGSARAEGPDELTAPLPITAPWLSPKLGVDIPPPQRAEGWTLFTNFDGGKMNFCGWGDNSPQNNCSTIMQDTVLPFSGDAGKRAAVVQVIRNDFQDFGIRVTDVRPQTGDYDMEMIGDWDPAPGGGFAGVAPSIDCFNNDGGEVSFTLDYTGSATGIAKAVLQEVAHTWGLEHVDSKEDLLYPTTESVMDPGFVDQCFQIVQLDNMGNPVPDWAVCKSQHSQFCGSNQQNSYRELLQIFGPHMPDLTAPTLSFLNPAEGATVEPSFDLILQAADDQSPQLLEMQIVLDGPVHFETDPNVYPSPADFTFPVVGVPGGDYTITATATDEEGNIGTAMVHFHVDAPSPGTTSGTTSDEPTGAATDDPTGGTSGGGGSSGGGESGDTDTGGGGQSSDEGCNCRGAGAPSSLALLVLLGLARGRRRSR